LELLKNCKIKIYDVSALGFIALFLLSGIMTLPQYGLSWDEGLGNLFYGERYFNYLTSFDSKYLDFNKPDLEIHKRALNLYDSSYRLEPREFPPFADTISAAMMEICAYYLPMLDPIDAFHLPKVLLSGAFLWLLYIFACPRLGKATAFLAILLLGTYPRFWGDMHFNPKDIPETIFFSLTLIAFYVWFEKPSWQWALSVGILFGLTLAIKANGVFIPIIIALVFLPWLYVRRSLKMLLMELRKYQGHFILMISSASLTLVAAWINPIMMMEYYKSISSVGREKSLAWNWDPIVQTITTMPEVMFLLLITGFLYAFSRIRSATTPIFNLIIIWTMFPIFRNSLPGMKNYDGIRHFEEFLPGACLLAAYGGGCLVEYLNRIKPNLSRLWVFSLFLVVIGNTTSIYIRYWPYEYLYYNSLIGGLEGANRKYAFPEATDYWGVSYRNGIRWMNANAEQKACLYTAIADWCIGTPKNIWLRKDIMVIPSKYIKENIKHGYPTYVMFITRESWYDSVTVYCERNLSPVHEIVVDGLPILKIYLLPSSIAKEAE
jgi:hypothetical protein